ncbi:hypothetical protein ElyMa_001916500 [Elysia marginata]|uniref:Uncharacterized protein n=1 Tax=Elysia marginata TaxID=1093978 RepID=A0AAV4ETD2_9GAST|nr:hypothetical protein ElyMa_001916500 [Elysia marginata]
MGPTCTSTYCQKSKSRHCSTFDEERRKAIFTEFWNMGSWDERYTYVKTIVKKVKRKRARSESEERDSSYEWNLLSTEGENKQDQCDVCVGFKHGNIARDVYEHHVARKSAAQEMKAEIFDKVTPENVSVWTMDLESVLMCPKTKASAMYYRTKLVVHNMTYFNLKTKEGFCYVFDESNTYLSSQIFGYLHHNHFSTQMFPMLLFGVMVVAIRINV